ncbi:MAG: hypothetical protein HOI88_00825 [Phycisphaerae bacterium]|nr:hypothetical protein [Phycisphaerae bacterium]
MKEQKKQDKQLELIQRLEKELKSSEAKPALSVFMLPVGVETSRGIDQMVSRELSRCFEMDGGKLVFPIDDGRIVEHEEDTTNNSGIVSWLRRGDWERCNADEVQGWEYGHAYTSRLLRMLAPIIEPKVLLPSDTTRTSTATALLKVVFGQRNKQRGNWSKFLRLRGAWNDQDEAKGWANQRHLLDFGWDLILKDSARFGVDFGQSMEPEEVREEQRGAKYWWIDIPDLTGLVLKILPTLERQREEELKAGNGNIREGKPRSVGRDKMRGGDSVEALEVTDNAQEKLPLKEYIKIIREQLKWAGWSKGDVKRFIEENGSSNDTLTVAIKKADAQGLCHKGKKPSSSIK